MNNSLEKGGHGFVQQSVRNVYAKFKVDRLSRFRTGARHVLATQKRFLKGTLMQILKSPYMF